ncbi:MAG TPA: bifunctional 2-methylcitrate dehydratase/aconitate hydratase [Candidatus Dormibacteraeota bacterium]|nr:bifunctional 2-methylcitrate dehydratase/aconitate hydratase [Candidatus Dormibacteraeota bacterium]
MKQSEVIERIADFCNEDIDFDDATMEIAGMVFKDSLGCMIKSLDNAQCQKMLGPLENDNFKEDGVKIPGIDKPLNLLDASWNIGVLIRWLDYNDCFLAEEWGHPSDNLGGILAAALHLNKSEQNITVEDVLKYMIKAHEIQGVLSLSNSLNRNGFDHVFLVKLATAAVTAKMMGGDKEDIKDALANAFIDAGPLRIYRHSPNVTARKSWAAGDATMRGVHLTLLSRKLHENYGDILNEPVWGFNDVIMNGKEITLSRDLDSYVINNILFKAGFPAEFHAQTAAEAAMSLHRKYKDRLDDIEEIKIETHESAIRIIAHKDKMTNPSDRDHSLEYIVAVSLLNGDLKTEYYYDEYHHNSPQIDELMKKMTVTEKQRYSEEYLEQDKRSIANSIQLVFKNGETSEEMEVEYPVGHKFRRDEVKPIIDQKFKDNLMSHFNESKTDELLNLFKDQDDLKSLSINEFWEHWIS